MSFSNVAPMSSAAQVQKEGKRFMCPQWNGVIVEDDGGGHYKLVMPSPVDTEAPSEIFHIFQCDVPTAVSSCLLMNHGRALQAWLMVEAKISYDRILSGLAGDYSVEKTDMLHVTHFVTDVDNYDQIMDHTDLKQEDGWMKRSKWESMHGCKILHCFDLLPYVWSHKASHEFLLRNRRTGYVSPVQRLLDPKCPLCYILVVQMDLVLELE